MTSDALTAYLFGLAVGCPLGIEGKHCPLRELQRGDLSATYDYLITLSRGRKVQIAEAHCQCARELEAGAPRSFIHSRPTLHENH